MTTADPMPAGVPACVLRWLAKKTVTDGAAERQIFCWTLLLFRRHEMTAPGVLSLLRVSIGARRPEVSDTMLRRAVRLAEAAYREIEGFERTSSAGQSR